MLRVTSVGSECPHIGVAWRKSVGSQIRSLMERSIPHIRSIFSGSRKKSDAQDLCQLERSPRRSRPRDPPVDYHEYERLDRPAAAPPPSAPHKSKEPQHRSKEESKSKSRNYNTYTSKTLTDRDMRHLERHLSMKKTIRKQISRNLAQAFLDNPDIFEPDDTGREDRHSDHQVPVQNVLDLLKVTLDDRDSGHSSPTPEDTEDDEEEVRPWVRPGKAHRNSETRGLVEGRTKLQDPEKKTSSIWKMFLRKDKR